MRTVFDPYSINLQTAITALKTARGYVTEAHFASYDDSETALAEHRQMLHLMWERLTVHSIGNERHNG